MLFCWQRLFVYLKKYFSGKYEDEMNNFINEGMFKDEMNNFINEEMVGDEMSNFNNEPIYDICILNTLVILLVQLAYVFRPLYKK